MAKKYGITNDPDRRERELRKQYVGFKNFKRLQQFPNKKTAQAWENGKSNAHPGGPKAPGPYYGYSFDYSGKK